MHQGTYISTVVTVRQTQCTLSIIFYARGWVQFWTVFSTPIGTLEPRRHTVKIGNTMSDTQEKRKQFSLNSLEPMKSTLSKSVPSYATLLSVTLLVSILC